jgi:hypothetical protein
MVVFSKLIKFVISKEITKKKHVKTSQYSLNESFMTFVFESIS